MPLTPRARGCVAAAASLSLLVAGAVVGLPPSTVAAEPGTADPVGVPVAGPLGLYAPTKVTVTRFGRHVYGDLGLKLVAGEEPVEIRTRRPSWGEPIEAEARIGDAVVPLPRVALRSQRHLSGMLRLKVARFDGTTVRSFVRPVCLNQWRTERIRPDAPARSPYPRFCPRGAFTIGAVQGIQAGWATSALGAYSRMRLPTGRFRVTARIARRYAAPMGLSEEDRETGFTLVVRSRRGGARPTPRDAAPSPGADMRPATREPAGAGAAVTSGPLPDLRSLPASGIGLDRAGRFLRFSATVWNAGDSPLVVDGFRDADSEHMAGYQYFFDTTGEQVGYERVGQFHWHQARTHRHWHFLDFARYSLLDADKREAVRSHKESFCLANTDAVDYTVEGADWRPQHTDLATSCGRRGSLSLRQVLSSGSGDTYAQFRAGQSFRVAGLPDGRYWIEVRGNPEGVLHEHSGANNAALRKIWLGTRRDGSRFVRVPQIGLIRE